MDIRVSGHQMDTGEALQNHVRERLTTIVDKYFSRALSSNVTFSPAPAGAFRCDIVMHVMQNLVLKGSSDASDAHVALDQAATFQHLADTRSDLLDQSLQLVRAGGRQTSSSST